MITLDGHKLSEFGLFCEKQAHPMTPTIENKSLSIPGKDGLYNFGSEIRERTLGFTLATIDANKVLLQRKLRKFTAFLFDSFGKPREINLTFDYEPDKYYRTKLASEINPDRILRTGKFEINFTCYDPYAYSVFYADEICWGNEIITFEYDYLMGHEGTTGLIHLTQPRTLLATVDGLAVKPIIEVSGSANGLSLFTGNYVINFPNFSNAAWVIDCDKYTVLKNGVNGFNEAKLREFILTPGVNFIDMTASTIDISIQIKFRDKYI